MICLKNSWDFLHYRTLKILLSVIAAKNKLLSLLSKWCCLKLAFTNKRYTMKGRLILDILFLYLQNVYFLWTQLLSINKAFHTSFLVALLPTLTKIESNILYNIPISMTSVSINVPLYIYIYIQRMIYTQLIQGLS